MAARGAALAALQKFEKGMIDRVGEELQHKRLEPRDAALAADLALGVVRNDRFLDLVLSGFCTRGLPKDPRTRSALRMGAYQLLLQEGMPARAAVYETVALLQRDQAFVNAVLRRCSESVHDRPADPTLPATEIELSRSRCFVLRPPGLADSKEPLALRHSLPDFLVARWRAAHGDLQTQRICAAASSQSALFLRACNGIDAETLAKMLLEDAVRTSPTSHPLVLRVENGAPFGSEAFRRGAFVAQDPTAVAAAEAVGAEPGMVILDLCAAPGTKATLLAERVKPGGVVFAYDPDPVRRKRIVENANRLRLADTLRVIADPSEAPLVDAVLADVPCSNTGVLQRRVEVRRRLLPGTFSDMAAIQRPILELAAQKAKPGGVVVYSTCSIEEEENGAVARAVAASHGLTIEREHLSLPELRVRDGGYFARMLRG
jgi:16S rRNA (cytosine967-C5)-methyltransferase